MSTQRQAKTAQGSRVGACVIQFSRAVRANSQRVADAQTLSRARATKALEETSKHVAEALKLLEPFNTAIVIAPTARLLKMCANGMGRVFDDLDHIGLVQSTVCSDGALAHPSAHGTSAVKETADVLALVGGQLKGGAQ